MSNSFSNTYNDEPKSRFTGIFVPVEILELESLNPTSMILLAWIDALYDKEKGGCFASNEYLSVKLKVTPKRVSEIISELMELGLVEKVSFDGRTRIIKACKEKWYNDRKAASVFKRRQTASKNGVYSKDYSCSKEQQQQPPIPPSRKSEKKRSVVVVDSDKEKIEKANEYEQRCNDATRIFKSKLDNFSIEHGDKWKISSGSISYLISQFGPEYVRDQIIYMCNQHEIACKDEEIADKKNKTRRIDKPEVYLSLACDKNYAKSTWRKKNE